MFSPATAGVEKIHPWVSKVQRISLSEAALDVAASIITTRNVATVRGFMVPTV